MAEPVFGTEGGRGGGGSTAGIFHRSTVIAELMSGTAGASGGGGSIPPDLEESDMAEPVSRTATGRGGWRSTGGDLTNCADSMGTVVGRASDVCRTAACPDGIFPFVVAPTSRADVPGGTFGT